MSERKRSIDGLDCVDSQIFCRRNWGERTWVTVHTHRCMWNWVHICSRHSSRTKCGFEGCLHFCKSHHARNVCWVVWQILCNIELETTARRRSQRSPWFIRRLLPRFKESSHRLNSCLQSLFAMLVGAIRLAEDDLSAESRLKRTFKLDSDWWLGLLWLEIN
jgi:hypothetical protein